MGDREGDRRETDSQRDTHKDRVKREGAGERQKERKKRVEQKDINRDGVGRPEKDKAAGRKTDGLMGEDTEEKVG